MKTSFIATVLNEEKTIEALLNSLANKPKNPRKLLLLMAAQTTKRL